MAKIDTLKYYKELKATGITDEQIEAMVSVINSIIKEKELENGDN